MDPELKQTLIKQYNEDTADRIEELVNALGDDIVDVIQDNDDVDNLISLLEDHGTFYQTQISMLLNDNASASQITLFLNTAIEYRPGITPVNRVGYIRETLNSFHNAIDKHELDIDAIIANYRQDEKHLEYMAGDPYDLIFEKAVENTLTTEEWNFVRDNDYIDDDNKADIEEGLGYDSDGHPTLSLINFRIAIGEYFDEQEEDPQDNHNHEMDIEYNLSGDNSDNEND